METDKSSLSIIFYGTGADAEDFYQAVLFWNEYWQDRVVCVVDGSPEKQGSYFHNYRIYSPDHIRDCAFDLVVILSTRYEKEIRDNLFRNYGVEEKKIIGRIEYWKRCCIYYQYHRNLELNQKKGSTDLRHGFDISKTVVYTAVFGDYDNLKSPAIVDKDVTYVCFTDDRSLKSDVWNMEYVKTAKDDDRAFGIRKYKLMPHKWFPEFTTSVWIDASLEICGSIIEYINRFSIYGELLLFPHPERWCVYDEGAEVIRLRKAPKIQVIRQLSHYVDEGYPEDNGLYCGGVIVSDTKNESIQRFYEEWLLQVEKYTRRDQLSLPYVSYKNDLNLDLCNLNIFGNEYMKYYAHKN